MYAMGLLIILIALFTITIVQDKKTFLEQKTRDHRELIRNAFDLSMFEIQNNIRKNAYEIAADRNIIDAFARHDREKLYRLTLPYFNKAKEHGESDLTGFILADGTHLLRMQNPEKYGDTVVQKRPALAHALHTQKPVTALDVTIYDVAIVTILPIFKDGKFIGVIQNSAKINRLQKRLNSHSGIKSALAFNTKQLEEVLERNSSQIHYKNYTLVSYDDTIFTNLPQSFSFDIVKQYSFKGKSYIVASRPLTDFRGNTVAMMICAFDISNDIENYSNQLIRLFAISALLLVIMYVILHFGFKILISRIDRDARITRELNHKLQHQLHTDHLTSLPNRNALLRDFHRRDYYALILLNIDNFKEINDFYGHEVGDLILLGISDALNEAIEKYPMKLYKMPSDEYAIVIVSPMLYADLDNARLSIARHLQTKHYDVYGVSIHVTLTMGMDIVPPNLKVSFNQLMANTDMALKAAKKRHLSFLLYNESMQIKQEYQNNIYWSKKLKEAIEQHHFALYYQPIIDAKTKEIYEYEALIRMVGTNDHIITPGYFLPSAKHSRLYPVLSRYVIDQIFEMLDKTPYRFSINLSVDDILDSNMRKYLFSKLSENSHGERLIFELIESEGIENYPEVSAFISEAKHYGVHIAIDDFGTGYSNFAHILSLQVDLLKIDGSLIRNIDTDKNAQTMVAAISEFSKRLGLKTVAEYVHSQEVYDKCIELGIDYLQGFHIGEPKSL